MNLSIASILLMAQPSGDGKSDGFTSFIPLILIVLVFYMFFIRPQMRKNKEMKKFRESIGKGDKIVTIGGIHGKIVEVQETTFIIEVEGQNRLKIERSAVSMDAKAQIAEKK